MKKNIAFATGLLILGLVAIGYVAKKNIQLMHSFSDLLNYAVKSQSSSDSVIFDLNLVTPIIETAKQVGSNKLATFFLQAQQREILNNFVKHSDDIKTVFSNLTVANQRWLIVYQNSNELRATGGFMGSYSILEINQGKIISIETEDIYDADGQFKGYFAAPPGVFEYLSGGHGLRLPDANWHPDTVESSKQILPFFAWGNKQNISGIIFVNLDFAKKLLSILGSIEIADYNTIVTEQNIDEVLRSRRDEFFPGSTQKKHMLSQLLTQVKLKISKFNLEQYITLLQLLGDEIQNQNLQFYSINESIDTVFEKNDMRQNLYIPKNSEYLFLVESNVGINKANKNVERKVYLKKNGSDRELVVEFQNQNKKPTTSKLTKIVEFQPNPNASKEATIQNHLAYVNYQRVLVPSNWELQSAIYQDKEIKKIDTEIITANNQQFKQIGFLIVVQEESAGILELIFTSPTDFETVFIQNQPGLSATKYVLEYNGKQSEHLVTKNVELKYP